LTAVVVIADAVAAVDTQAWSATLKCYQMSIELKMKTFFQFFAHFSNI